MNKVYVLHLVYKSQNGNKNEETRIFSTGKKACDFLVKEMKAILSPFALSENIERRILFAASSEDPIRLASEMSSSAMLVARFFARAEHILIDKE